MSWEEESMSKWTNIKLGDAINFNPAERIKSGAIAKKSPWTKWGYLQEKQMDMNLQFFKVDQNSKMVILYLQELHHV